MQNICIQKVREVLRENEIIRINTFNICDLRKPVILVIHSHFDPQQLENLFEQAAQ